MSEKAFPAPYWNDDRMMYLNQGMTLRDYFAAKAMQGWIAALSAESLDELDSSGDAVFRQHAACVADAAFMYADAMIAARGNQ